MEYLQGPILPIVEVPNTWDSTLISLLGVPLASNWALPKVTTVRMTNAPKDPIVRLSLYGHQIKTKAVTGVEYSL